MERQETFIWRRTRSRPREETVSEDLSDAVTFAQTRLKFFPDEMQIEVLQSTAKRGILNCTRQWGKSTVSAAKALHRAYTVPESLVLVASRTERQSALFLEKAAAFVRQLQIKPRGDGVNKTSLLLPNGSRIVGLPGTEATVRGFSAVSMILIDEASRVSDDMYKALRPMLAVSDGDLWMMSTPNGQRGFFYETWTEGDEDWMRISVKATDCPRISHSYLERVRRGMTQADFSQEFMCEFTGDGTEYFDQHLIHDALDESYPQLDIPKGY